MNDSRKSTAPGPRFYKKPLFLIGLTLLVLCVLAGGGFYRYIVSGGMTARQKPSAVENFVAQGLVNLGIPDKVKVLKNPLSTNADGADVAAGRELYRKNCETCHGYDGSGKTAAGGGMFPPPLSLRRAALAERKRTDGELFYFVRNGVRNTGMPGWQ